MKITYIRTNGRSADFSDKGKLSLEQMQSFVGGLIEIVELPDGREMVLNEEGRLEGLPVNEKATEIWNEAYPIEDYPLNNMGDVVGDVLILQDYNWD